MAAVEAGNADAAVIYRTDAIGRSRVRIEYLVPLDQGPPISYPAGIVAASRHAEKARALLSWLRSDVATGVFKAAGFGVPAVVAR